MNPKEFNDWWKNLGCNSLFFDKALKGKPRPVGESGVIFHSKGNNIKEYSWGIGKNTNNGVEWLALIKGLELVKNLGIEDLANLGYSMMVIKEARNLSKNQKKPKTKTHHILKCMVDEYKAINFLHLLRANNQQADIMANKGVDLECDVLVLDQKVFLRNWIP